MINRRIEAELMAWKASPDPRDRKPILLRGARQVGKTFTVREFAKSYPSSIVLDLERPADRNLFTHPGSGKELWETILLSRGSCLDPRDTLLFIDEIQNSPEAVRALRFLHEDLPELSVIAAGSLFEVFAHQEGFSFPVGRVRNLFLSPVSFDEYLGAANPPLRRVLDEFEIGKILPDGHHALLTDAFRRFAFIGGMPEAVARFLERGSFAGLGPIHDSILRGYLEDAQKYSSPAKAKYLTFAVDRAPFHIAERISYDKFGGSNFRSREMKEALVTLAQALVLHLAEASPSVRLPLRESGRRAPKLFFVDSGLVNHRLGLRELFPPAAPLDDLYRGHIAEQIVAQEIIASSFERPSLSLWAREKGHSEVDFLLSAGGLALPLEVKSGKPGKMRSLAVFMDLCDHPFALRVCDAPLHIIESRSAAGKPFRLLSLPFYALPRWRDLVASFIEIRGHIT